jgi:phosphate starvation-inducible protein PhoH and related proteins
VKDWRKGQDMFYGFRDVLTDEQMIYLDSMQNNLLTISNSVSGSGKTTLAVALAHYQEMNLLYIFFPVQEGVMGFRPGGQQTKESAYFGPLQDALLDIGEDPSKCIKLDDLDEALDFVSREDKMLSQFNKKKKSKQKQSEDWTVEAKSHIFLRGTNQGKGGNLVVIIDEAQNGTKKELKKILTRIHDDAKVVVIGHTGQCDLQDPSNSGFPRLIEHFSKKPYAKLCNLTHNFRGQLSKDADEM